MKCHLCGKTSGLECETCHQPVCSDCAGTDHVCDGCHYEEQERLFNPDKALTKKE